MYKNIYHGVYIPTPHISNYDSAVEVLKKFGLKNKGMHNQYLGVNLSEPIFAGSIYSFHSCNTGGSLYLINDFLNDYTPKLEIGQSYTFKEIPYVPVINDEIKASERGNFKVNINTELTPLIGYQIDKELGPVYTFGLKGSTDKAYIAVEFKDIHELIPVREWKSVKRPSKAPIMKNNFLVVTVRFTVEQFGGNDKVATFTPGDILLVEDIPREGIYQVFGNFFVPEHIVRLAKVQEVIDKRDSIGFGGIRAAFKGSGIEIMGTKLGADELKAIRILMMQDVKMTLGGTTIGLNEYYYLHLFSGIPYNI